MQSPSVGRDRPPRWRRPAQVVGAVVALLLAGLAGYALAPRTPAAVAPPPAAAGASPTPSADTASSAPGPAAQPAPTAPAAPAAPPPAPAGVASFTAWRGGGGLDLVNAVTSDLDAVTSAGPSARQPLCATLGRDVDAARSHAPMPDATAQSAWSTGLAHAGKAAAACSVDPASDVTAELQGAVSGIDAATERMSYFAGH